VVAYTATCSNTVAICAISISYIAVLLDSGWKCGHQTLLPERKVWPARLVHVHGLIYVKPSGFSSQKSMQQQNDICRGVQWWPPKSALWVESWKARRAGQAGILNS
jgi:hypothetical protein